jgi:hypothetical protein
MRWLPTVRLMSVWPAALRQAAKGAVVQGRGGALPFPDHLALGVVFPDRLFLRHEMMAVRQRAGHPALQVMVLGLAAQGNLGLDRAVAGYHQEARPVARFREHDVSAREQDRRVHFGLRTFVFPDDLQVARHFDDGPAWAGFVLRKREQQVAVGQHLAVARGRRIFPGDLAGAVHDLRQAPEHQERTSRGFLRRRRG